MHILIEKNIMMPLRDGALLATDLYRNADGLPAPVLVVRLPYDKERSVSPEVMTLVQSGYHLVIQDARGRFASQGEFNANFQEINDGADCYAWVAQQPWCDGRVGTFGGSYLGQVQWLAAPYMPAAVKALSVLLAPVDHYSDVAYRGGVLNLGSMLFWCSMMALGEQGRRLADGRAAPEAMQQQALALFNLAQLYETLPLAEMTHLQGVSPHFFNWLAHPTYDDFWRRIDARNFAQIDKPMLHIGGWYDIFLNGTLQGYIGMRNHAQTAEARSRQKLLIGPWSHGTNWTSSYHEQDFGMHAGGEAVNLTGLQMRWLDRWVKGIENGVEQEPPVRIFVMGINQWRDEQDWPLPDTRYTPYYLHSGGRANTLNGDGALATALPGAEPADRFVYDPHNPVPSVGGANLTPFANSIGPRDQLSVEEREDVLVFSTPVLTQAVEVTGPIKAHFYVASSAPDTDITCKLVDVHPDGRAMLLTDGILRLRYRQSFTQPTLLQPDEIAPITIDLWSTANVFLPGHRIRIEVSSSCFPKFARNSNTGGDVATEPSEQYQTAVNHIYHTADYPSHVLLPIIESV
ncbi:MAG: CocE/NonD family hydrolase [Caldilineaceae bacterium]